MKILIIEDEPATAERLKKILLETTLDFQFYDIIDTVEESIEFFRSGSHVDLAFMDIHLADGKSFEIFDNVQVDCPIIFTTAYDQYAIEAFKVNSVDYLLKPIKRDDLTRSLKKFERQNKNVVTTNANLLAFLNTVKQNTEPKLERLVVRLGQKILVIKLTDISYFYIEDKIVYATLFNGKKYPVEFTLDKLESNTDPSKFFRVNRGFLVSIEGISTMNIYSKSKIKIELNPKCNIECITSSEKSGAFKKWLKGDE